MFKILNRKKLVERLPITKPLPIVVKSRYTVHSQLDPVTFAKKKDAETFRRLLKLSVHAYESNVVRTDMTDTGYYMEGSE